MEEKENHESLYYSHIEDLFVNLRGSPLLLTGKDFALMKAWYQAGVPLRVVLEGIREAFKKFEQKKPGPGERINALRYCKQAVLRARRAAREGRVGKPSSAEKSPQDDAFPDRISEHLEKLLAACRNSSLSLEGDRNHRKRFRKIIDRLEGLLREMQRGVSMERGASMERGVSMEMEEIEKQLMSLERNIIKLLRKTTPEDTIEKLATDFREKIMKRSDTITRKELEALTEKLVNEKLLSDAGIPRLSLITL